MTTASKRLRAEIGGRVLSLSNLDKVLYPETGFTKGEVIDYYARAAAYLLPHVRERALTRKRWPDGTGGEEFFEKMAPRGTPEWVRTVDIDTPDSTKGYQRISYVVADDVPTIVWLANLAALELHVPQWRVAEDDETLDADLIVFDLDPGPPATVVECSRVALLLRELLAADGLTAWAKTSGSKGMQLAVPIAATAPRATSAYAKRLADRLASDHPDLVVSQMTKRLRTGKVFVDWSQNSGTKTTIAAYSLRGREHPTVSTPLWWDEVEACEAVVDLTFEATDVLERLDGDGDPFAGLHDDHHAAVPGD